MSRYLYGLFWNTVEHFDFVYTNKNDDKKNKTNTINLDNIDIINSIVNIDKSTVYSVEISNIQVDTLNSQFCELPFESLVINCCKINSIENLSVNTKLKKLIIIDSDVKDVKKLENMNITNLIIINTKNIDIDEILIFKNLIELVYKSNKIEFMVNLESLDNLQILNLSNNKIKDITNMGFIKSLISLDIGHNEIENIDIIQKYDRLKYLYINNNLIKNINPIQNNNNLKFLNISNNLIENIDLINNFIDLEMLNALNNPIIYLPDLMKFKNLDFDNLKINWNNIKDIKGMKGFRLIKNIIKSLINK